MISGSLGSAALRRLAGGLLAGVLLEICLAPMRAVGAMPALALPVVLVWALAWRFARLYAVPAAVVVAAVLIAVATPLPEGAMASILPHLEWVTPRPELGAAIGIGLPLFLALWLGHRLVTGSRMVRYEDADLTRATD